jgi:phosphatidylcholine synthase
MAEHPLPVRSRAFAVHLLTASGAALGLLALLAATQAQWTLMFLLLGAALVVDGVDGWFARRLDVAQILPNWSGEVLDYVVDFVTYVMVPAYAISIGGLLPPKLAVAGGLTIMVTGALYFADMRMKTSDHYFRGFPAVWNMVAFYLFLLRPEPWLAAVAVAIFAALTFVPMVFVHPVRVKRLRGLTLALLVLWSLLAAFALTRDLAPGPLVTGGLCVIALYFLGLGLVRRGPGSQGEE